MNAIAQLNMMLARKRGTTPSAADILGRLRDQGIELQPHDGNRIKVARGKLDEEQRVLIRQHREAILDYLTGPEMKFDFWVPDEAECIARVLLIRIKHHEWPACEISHKAYGHAQEEIDLAFLERNGERLRRAESRLHEFMDREPFSLDDVERRIWFEPRNDDLAGYIQAPGIKKRQVCRGVPEHNKDLLDRYLGEFAASVKDCKVKVERVR